MTIQSARLLRKLKKAQVHQDWSVQIDYNKFTASTYNTGSKDTVVVNLARFRHSMKSVLHELGKHDYIEIGPFGHISVTHVGWCAFGVTVQDAVKFTVRDVIVPIVVSLGASIALEVLEIVIKFP